MKRKYPELHTSDFDAGVTEPFLYGTINTLLSRGIVPFKDNGSIN